MNVEKYLFNVSPTKIKLGLERTQQLLKVCGNPEKKIFTIQLVGTNGKGSTAAMLAHILNEKYKVGLFTSPHLVDYKERVRINFKKIKDEDVKFFLKKYKKEIKVIQPSFFEIMTVLSVCFFYKNKVDIAILETGLGGRLDSVTCCNNNILGFTNIDLDHQHILGNSIKQIAKEKALAMQNYRQKIFSVPQSKVVKKVLNKRAKELNIKINITKNSQAPKRLQGKHQLINASLAETIARDLMSYNYTRIKKEDIKRGLNKAVWPGRFQIIKKNPTIIYDVAHNQAGIESFTQTVKSYLKNKTYKNKILICGFEEKKSIKFFLINLTKLFDKIICTETGTRQNLDCEKLAHYFNNSKVSSTRNIKEVFNITKKQDKKTLVCIIGSHYFGPHISKFYNKSFAKI